MVARIRQNGVKCYAFTVELSSDISTKLVRRSIDEKRSKASIIREALVHYLSRYERRKQIKLRRVGNSCAE